MKKILGVFIFLAFIAQIIKAQEVTVSEEINMRSDEGYALLGKFKDRFLVFHTQSGDKFEVQSFDEKMRLSWKKDLFLDKKNPKILEVIPYNNHFTIIYTCRKKGDFLLKAAKYDAAANLKDSVTFKNLGSRWYSPKIEIEESEDRSKAVVYILEKQSYYDLFSFDLNSMTLLWENKIRPDRLIEQRDFETTLVDNKGNFYYLQEKDNRKSKLDEHRVEIYNCRGAEESSRSNTLIDLSEKLTYQVDWKVDNKNGRLVAGGLYSENNRARANGYFLISIDSDLIEDAKFKSVEFDTKFIQEISGKGIDDEKGVSEIDVRELKLRRDGSVVMFLERAKELERRLASGAPGYVSRNGSGYIVDYYYDDIIGVSINSKGEIDWKEVFHKKQYSQDDGAAFSSFFVYTNPSRLRLIFNDDIKSETTVSEYVVRADGNSDRNSLLATDDQELKLKFREAIQVASNEFVVPSEKRNKLKLVRVIY